MPKHDEWVDRLRELAAEVDYLRTAKATNLTKRSAVEEAAEVIADPECNSAWMEKVANRLFNEAWMLSTLPDAETYETFQAPTLDDDWEF